MIPKVERPEEGAVFYNPVQELSRDFSVAVYSAMGVRSVCDPLAATGARGVRIAREIGIPVTCGDISKVACGLIKKNARENRVASKVSVASRNANSLMAEGFGWDAVDIDPFGSPVPFVDLAARAAGSVLAITATDPAALCGVYPRVTWRKYLARVVKTDFYHEVGIRILAGYAVRMAAKYEVALTPRICHSSNHYYRIYFGKEKGSKRSDSALENIGSLFWCPSCGFRSSTGKAQCICDSGSSRIKEIGPLYIGGLFDGSLCKAALAEADKRGFGACKALLERISKEASLPAFHYEHHALCSFKHTAPGKLEVLLGALRGAGFSAERTHFSENGFRTDAPLRKILEIV
ncbi:MAG: tRNA (guanine(26)-N(2))-dimethyltransferase [archaeon]